MGLSDRALAWVMVAVVAVLAASGLAFLWVRGYLAAPACGDDADAQLSRAVDELTERIPGLRFTAVGDSCDSGGRVYAVWNHDELGQLLPQAEATGCRADARDPDDLSSYLSVTCHTSERDVKLNIKLGSVPLEGELVLA
jgi:hypothetical protein